VRRIFKYTVPVDDQPHSFELTGEPLYVAATALGEEVEFWAEHDDEALEFTRTFQVVGTGHELPKCTRYIGTGKASRLRLVWHLVEVVKPCQAR
jgi:hypothetical protein